MKIPRRLQPLIQDGLINKVVTQLMSGKEATVYVVHSEGELRCAKVYKEANQRSFKHNTQYTEGRKERNSRRGRAMGKNSRYGRREQEDAWQNAEVEALYRLAAAGVCVPKSYAFMDGVLLMELVLDGDGNVAPRLHDVELTKDIARDFHTRLIREIVRMLCAGIIHGDLSEFNVLVGADGPVIIDLPQAVDSAGNNSAFRLLERDVNNIRNFLGRHAPELIATEYAKEIWDLYKNGKLLPDSKLTGRFESKGGPVNVSSVLHEIEEARNEEMERRERKN